MPRPSKDSLEWYKPAADLMARDEKLSLRQAADLSGVQLSIEEATSHQRRKSFQRVLWDAKHAWTAEIGRNPGRSKEALEGKLELAASKLLEEGQWKAAAEVLMTLAKVSGWVGGDASLNVFANLNAKDFEQLREQLRDKIGPEVKPSTQPAN